MACAILGAFAVACHSIALPASVSLALTFAPLGNEIDLASVAKKYNHDKTFAAAQSKVRGKSGVEHQFAIVIGGKTGAPTVVAETILSDSEVDETKVLAFFVKAFDVESKNSILCVSPRLNPRASQLANQYKMRVLESPEPRRLPAMLSEAIEGILS